jgi:hypothetical protein
MDPLSIIASVLTLATAAAQIGTAISRLRHFGEVPGKIYALKNEVSDLEVVLRQIGQALKQKSLAPDNAHGSLEQVLARTKGHLTDSPKRWSGSPMRVRDPSSRPSARVPYG